MGIKPLNTKLLLTRTTYFHDWADDIGEPEGTPTQLFSYEYCKIFKSTYFDEHLGTATSEDTS